MTAATRPGEWVHSATGLADIGPDTFNTRIPTDRYTSREYAAREREAIWMRVWQIAGRVDELPKPGDWKEYRDLRPVLPHRARQGRRSSAASSTPAGTAATCCAPAAPETPSAASSASTTSGPTTSKADLRGVLRENLVGPIDKERELDCSRCRSTPSPVSSSSTPTPMPRRWPSSSATRSPR